MTIATHPAALTPNDVEAISQRDGKLYELIEGSLSEKRVGTEALFVAVRIASVLNAAFYPHQGAAVVEAMLYCFGRPNHGRKPDVTFFHLARVPGGAIPAGDLYFPPELVVEVLSKSNTGIEVERKLDEYLVAGIKLVWIVTPEWRTIRAYRHDGTTQLFHAGDTIVDEPTLPGLKLKVEEIFPVLP